MRIGFGLCLTISEARVRAARHTLMRRAMVVQLPHGDGVGPTVRLWASATRLRLRYNVHARRFHRLCAWAAVCNADFLLLASVSYRLALDPSGPAEVLQSTASLTQVSQRSNSSADRYIGEQQRQQRHRFQPKDKIALIESTRVPAPESSSLVSTTRGIVARNSVAPPDA